MKTCKDCGLEKPIEEFYPHQNDCKICFGLRVKANRIKNIEKYSEYDRMRIRYNKKYLFNHRYSGMKLRVEGKGSRLYSVKGKELLSREEFIDWCEKNIKSFDRLFRVWAKSGFSKRFSPSIDRIDNNRGYALDNIQWLHQHQNSSKDYQSNLSWKNRTRNEKGQFKGVK